MALNTQLSTMNVEQLIKDDTFISALLPKIAANDGATGIYTKEAVDTALAGKVNVTGDNLQLPAFVAALAAGDGDNGVYTKTAADAEFLKTANLGNEVKKSAVVDVLVPALATVGTDDTKKVYTKAAADTAFVNANGSNAGAIVTALAKDPAFIAAAQIQVAIENQGFQGAVRGVVSQPVFDIPADSSAPISADW